EGPALYDRLMHECYRGGLNSPHVVQEAGNEATVLSLVSHGIGIGWINETALWRCPKNVIILPVSDLDMRLPLVVWWRKARWCAWPEQFMSEVWHRAGRE